jgi:hypothetical protein
VIAKRGLSASGHVGQRFVPWRIRGGAIFLGLGLRGGVAGCTPESSQAGLRWARSTAADGERGGAGPPPQKICTALLDNAPLIDGFVRTPVYPENRV